MAQDLSRRGLLTAFRPDRFEAAPARALAGVTSGCLDAQGVGCRRCPEVCDAGAISFRLIGRGRAEPVISAERCEGCGACAAICPVSAIVVAARPAPARPAQGAAA